MAIPSEEGSTAAKVEDRRGSVGTPAKTNGKAAPSARSERDDLARRLIAIRSLLDLHLDHAVRAEVGGRRWNRAIEFADDVEKTLRRTGRDAAERMMLLEAVDRAVRFSSARDDCLKRRGRRSSTLDEWWAAEREDALFQADFATALDFQRARGCDPASDLVGLVIFDLSKSLPKYAAAIQAARDKIDALVRAWPPKRGRTKGARTTEGEKGTGAPSSASTWSLAVSAIKAVGMPLPTITGPLAVKRNTPVPSPEKLLNRALAAEWLRWQSPNEPAAP